MLDDDHARSSSFGATGKTLVEEGSRGAKLEEDFPFFSWLIGGEADGPPAR